jgi:hypothetical protein
MLELAASAISTGLTSRGSSSDGHGRRWLMLAVCRLKSEYMKQLVLRPDSQGLEVLASGRIDVGLTRRWTMRRGGISSSARHCTGGDGGRRYAMCMKEAGMRAAFLSSSNDRRQTDFVSTASFHLSNHHRVSTADTNTLNRGVSRCHKSAFFPRFTPRACYSQRIASNVESLRHARLTSRSGRAKTSRTKGEK